uniref:Uncharacterized protein n=1 Tax=Anguilla anguilla TaxID=7936 RepID=A0A0E9TW51_ANGAN
MCGCLCVVTALGQVRQRPLYIGATRRKKTCIDTFKLANRKAVNFFM